MAKLRQNHTRTGKRPFSGLLVRVILMMGIMTIILVYAFRYLDSSDESVDLVIAPTSDADHHQLVPVGNTGQVVSHTYYTIGYNEQHEQADWVAYILTKEQLTIPNVPRTNRFEEDEFISTRSAKHHDYSGSGYSRGHLAPAGDMAFSKQAMEESFLMSNMSPQIIAFNGGIWRELEECTRDWAYKNDRLFIATGPIFDGVTKYIGKSSKVRVPSAFFKIIADIDGSERKGIAFIIDNEKSDRSLSHYIQSIDDVEAITGMDFFDGLYKDHEEEQKIEGRVTLDLWPISQKRFQSRINHWNNN